MRWVSVAFTLLLASPVAAQNLPQVANNAALRALPSRQFNAVFRLGNAAAGDGGAQFYTGSQTACSLNGGNGDDQTQVRAADGGCWVGFGGLSGSQAVSGSVPSQIGDFAVWNNTTGTQLRGSSTALGAGIFTPVNYTSPPAWNAHYGNYNAVRISLGNYPASGETVGQPGEQTDIPNALFAGINIPANTISSPATHGSGVAGMALSASAQNGAVGVYGFGGQTADNVSSWGMNPIVTNCPTPSCRVGTGYSANSMWGLEVDVNYMRKGTVVPGPTRIHGVDIVGVSDTQVGPGGYSWGVVVRPMGIGETPPIPWQNGFVTGDGAAINALAIGARGLPGTVSDSQPICLAAYGGTTTPLSSCIYNDSGGELVMNAVQQTIFQIQGTALMQLGMQNLILWPIAATPAVPSVALLLESRNNTAGLMSSTVKSVPNASQTAADLVFDTQGGSTIMQSNGVVNLMISPNPPTGFSVLQVRVNNNAGSNIAGVSLGDVSSCGAGYRCLRVVN